jgi:uncharacterized membrane protein YadS
MKSKIHEYQKNKLLLMSKKFIPKFALLFLILAMFTSCSAIEGIFKAGMGVGIFIVVAVIVLIVFIISKLGGKK